MHGTPGPLRLDPDAGESRYEIKIQDERQSGGSFLSTREKKDKENTFFIVSGKNAAYPGEMLYPSGFLGAFDTWHYDKKKPDGAGDLRILPGAAVATDRL